MNENKLARRIQVIKMYVAQGRPGVCEMQYRHQIPRRNPSREKVLNGMSAMIDQCVDVEVQNEGTPLPAVYKRTSRDTTKKPR
jgi:hypothetical protein